MPRDPGVDPCAGEMPMPPRLLSGARASVVLRSHASRRRSACDEATHRLRGLRAAPAAPGVADVPPAATSCSRASSCASLALTWPRGVPVVVVCAGGRRRWRQRTRVAPVAPRTARATWLQCLHRIVTRFCAAPPAARLPLRERTRTLQRGTGSAAELAAHAAARAAAHLQVSPGSSTAPQKSHVLGCAAAHELEPILAPHTRSARTCAGGSQRPAAATARLRAPIKALTDGAAAASATAAACRCALCFAAAADASAPRAARCAGAGAGLLMRTNAQGRARAR